MGIEFRNPKKAQERYDKGCCPHCGKLLLEDGMDGPYKGFCPSLEEVMCDSCVEEFERCHPK